VEAVELNVGVETLRKRLDYLLAYERLGAMGQDIDDDRQRKQKCEYTSADPEGPACSAPRRGSVPLLHHLLLWMPRSRWSAVFSA